MVKISPAARLAISLAALTVSAVMLAFSLQILPERDQAVYAGRRALCESIAIYVSVLAQRDDDEGISGALEAINRRNPQIRSLAILDAENRILVDSRSKTATSRAPADDAELDRIEVPILQNGQLWGKVEVLFDETGPGSWYQHPIVALGVIVGSVSFLAFYIYMRKILQVMNPSRVIPTRVRSALDTLAEGLMVLDNNGRIMLANSAFQAHVGCDKEDLIGFDANLMAWSVVQDDEEDRSLTPQLSPWTRVIETGLPQSGCLLRFARPDDSTRTFVVSSVPVRDEKGTAQGVVASFEDITPLEEKKAQLASMLETVRASSDRIRQQNEELERLATRDPLTACYNRRSFLERFELAWSQAARSAESLSLLMLDVDHFKQVNDNHGHSLGDEVLKGVGQLLLQAVRDYDTVCRFGGEEFAILLPTTTLDESHLLAERIRRRISETDLAGLRITVSLGVSATQSSLSSPQMLLDDADRCLYSAKRTGRNRVVRSDRRPDSEEILRKEGQTPKESLKERNMQESSIPFPAVTSLISALAFRDPRTAEHSRRVADLCVATAEGLMSLSHCYALETAALLHDIGKIGVPDSILLKPAALTKEEWATMRKHERMGSEIIRASFASETVSQIVDGHHQLQAALRNDSPINFRELPIGARILSIADAFDSMTTINLYRQHRSRDEAYEELRCNGGRQFDPELVERFISINRSLSEPRQFDFEISKDVALNIGMHLEQLVAAVDTQDMERLRAIAEHLAATANSNGSPEIADSANDVVAGLEDGVDLLQILNDANELLDICRSTQAMILQHHTEMQSEVEQESDSALL